MPRYIEATNAISVLSLFYNYTDAERYDLALAISAVPTADVVERRRGKWIQHGAKEGFLIERYTCSVCSYYSGTKTSNFCPDCGADMREGSNNERTD